MNIVGRPRGSKEVSGHGIILKILLLAYRKFEEAILRQKYCWQWALLVVN